MKEIKAVTNLSSEGEAEEEVEDAIGETTAERMLEIDLIALQQEVRVFGAPVEQNPNQMVLDHRNGGVGDVALLLSQCSI